MYSAVQNSLSECSVNSLLDTVCLLLMQTLTSIFTRHWRQTSPLRLACHRFPVLPVCQSSYPECRLITYKKKLSILIPPPLIYRYGRKAVGVGSYPASDTSVGVLATSKYQNNTHSQVSTSLFILHI